MGLMVGMCTVIVVVECTRLMEHGTSVGLRRMGVLSCVLVMQMCIGRCDYDMLCVLVLVRESSGKKVRKNVSNSYGGVCKDYCDGE